MGCLFSCCKSNKEKNHKNESIPNLTNQEKEEIANKRLQYINNKYPPQKPMDKTKSIDIPIRDEKRHQQYIKDWRD